MTATLQTLFQQHYSSFAQKYRVSSDMARAAWALIHCRTSTLGGHVNSCPHGHFHQIAYNSCRHRCCPQCSWLPTEQWLQGWKKRLLPCPHHHLVFTLPHQLNDIWRYNKAQFANVLFAAASQTLMELLADPKYLGAKPGILAALHTWNQTLQTHVHLHVILTAGGLSNPQGWLTPQKSCLLPRQVLMIKFRGKFKALLRQKLSKGLLRLPPGFSVADFETLLHKLTQSPWNVKVHDAYRNALSVATYLARYLKGGPIGKTRILSVENGRVTFRYRLSAKQGGDGKAQGILSLPVDTFIGRWLTHVPPKRFQSVRGYGLYGGNQHSQREQAAEQLGVVGEVVSVDAVPETWQAWCETAGMTAACRCPKCGATLISHHEFTSGRGPPPGAFKFGVGGKESKVA